MVRGLRRGLPVSMQPQPDGWRVGRLPHKTHRRWQSLVPAFTFDVPPQLQRIICLQMADAIAGLCCRLEAGLVPAAEFRALLASDDEALVHAAIVQLDKFLRSENFEMPMAATWLGALPDDLLALPPESQITVAHWVVDGITPALPLVTPTPVLPPLVRLAWLRAAVLERPALLDEFELTALGFEAVRELPCERVIGTGLLERLVASRSVDLRRHALGVLRTGLTRGLLARASAHELALRLAHDGNAAIAIDALRLLQGTWSFSLPLGEVRVALDVDLELGREVLRLFSVRRSVSALRRALVEGVPEALLSDLLLALGAAGDGADVASIVECARLRWSLCGAAAIEALQALKRRGNSVDPTQARTLVELFVEHAARADVRSVAEVVSSRADLIVDTAGRDRTEQDGDEQVGALPLREGQWPVWVSLLEALGTRRAIERLVEFTRHGSVNEALPCAIMALGRLGIREAEHEILARLDDEPQACLAALRHVGGAQSARALRERVSRGLGSAAPPAWLQQAALLAFRLEPSERLLEDLMAGGAITHDLLSCLPDLGSGGVHVLSALASAANDPCRGAAIAALGKTGSVAAFGPLCALLSETELSIRDQAIEALRALGRRLHVQRAAYPACIEESAEPAEACVAEALILRLRERSLTPDTAARLLEPLIGLHHPGLVAAVRPYLRRKEAEVRKRALACLAAAGPAAAAWLLPWVSSEDVTVARQALRALAQTRAAGVAEPVARWLDAQNMNMKKAAAEALSALGDASVVPRLLHWLSVHDNPGFRALLLTALESILGATLVSALIDAIEAAREPRRVRLLAEALSGKLSAPDLAAIIAVRGLSDTAQQGLLHSVYEGHFILLSAARSGSTLTALDVELERRGLTDRIPNAESLTANEARAQLSALRAGRQLALALRRPAEAVSEGTTLELLLARANVDGQMFVPTLSASQLHNLLTRYAGLGQAAKVGVRRVLEKSALDPVARLRVRRALAGEQLRELPPALSKCVVASGHAAVARSALNVSDRELRHLAARVMLIDSSTVAPTDWSKQDASLFFGRELQRDALEACFDWARQNAEVPALFTAVRQRYGAAFAVAQVRRWLDAHPYLATISISALCAVGADAALQLERIAISNDVTLALRSNALTSLLQCSNAFATQALCEGLLDEPHAVLREQAAQWLWAQGESRLRALVLRRFIAGAFREGFRLLLTAPDLPYVDAAVSSATDMERSRCVLLLQGAEVGLRIARLIELWTMSNGDARREARDALRAVNPSELLNHLRGRLQAGDERVLEVIGQCRVLPAWVVACCARSVDLSGWLAFFERMAAGSTLHAPGLSDVLSERLEDARLGAAALGCLLRCDDWLNSERHASLFAALKGELNGSRRGAVLAQLVVTTEMYPVDVRMRILTTMGSPSDEPIALALMDSVLATPGLRRSLPAPWSAAIERRMRSELKGQPERARRILGYLSARSESETERAELLDLLEQGLHHVSPRVHLYAHRLLRAHADRARYLEASKRLLDSPDPVTLRTAIRTLAFGRSLSALGPLAELVFHGNGSVRKAACDGVVQLLVHLGDEARAGWLREVNHARPDRRAPLLSLLERASTAGT